MNKNISEKYIKLNKKSIELLFPKIKNVDMEKLLMSDVGLYSITLPADSLKISNLISKYFKNSKNIIITDGTSGMGGNVINMATNFIKVNAVEYSQIHCNILKNNVAVYNLQNVKIYCDDYTKIFKNIKQDVIFLDPPWGGHNYYKTERLKLFLGKHDIVHFINLIKNNAKLIVLKVPFNFDLTHMMNKIDLYKVKIVKFKKYFIIFIKTQ
jgi:16S rRNA G966 N2-methylase RsmD